MPWVPGQQLQDQDLAEFAGIDRNNTRGRLARNPYANGRATARQTNCQSSTDQCINNTVHFSLTSMMSMYFVSFLKGSKARPVPS